MRDAAFDASESVEALGQIPIRECGEPLVDFREAGPRVVWLKEHVVFRYQRATVARVGLIQRLRKAADSLPRGMTIQIVEGWRDRHIQRRMWLWACQRTRREHPDWDEARVVEYTNQFSAPYDHNVPPPHVTGGAVDLRFADAEGVPLDVTSPFGELNPEPAPFDAEGLTETARANRALMKATLEAVGITNYAREFWHWSYGDSGWAYRGRHPCALYGETRPDGWALAPEDAADGPLPTLDDSASDASE